MALETRKEKGKKKMKERKEEEHARTALMYEM